MKHRGKRLWGILLSPGLVLVMGMSLTAYADDPVPVTDIDLQHMMTGRCWLNAGILFRLRMSR